MKTAISIPDSLYESIQDFLEKTGMSRSEFFQRAARIYLDRIAAGAITANLNRVYADGEDEEDVAFRRAALEHLSEILDREDW